jgi:hypothetical protein
MSELGRYLVDYENPDAGIGHSLGHVNNAVKICLRHGLTFAYSDSQVRKSSSTQWAWRIKQWIRRMTFRQVYETHNIVTRSMRCLDFLRTPKIAVRLSYFAESKAGARSANSYNDLYPIRSSRLR